MRKIYFWLTVFVVSVGFISTPSIASAQSADIQVEDTVASLELSALTVTAVVSLFIPIVVGLITKADLSALWKGAINIVLSAVNAAIVTATVADGTAVFSKETLIAAFFGMVVSLATYLQIYKPLDTNSKLAPTKGI